jgi:hypothetical protein
MLGFLQRHVLLGDDGAGGLTVQDAEGMQPPQPCHPANCIMGHPPAELNSCQISAFGLCLAGSVGLPS